MKLRPTFFNTRNERLYWNQTDTNNYLFIIFFDSGATLNFILRDLKKNESIKNYIYKKLNSVFCNIAEIDISKLSYTEYNLMKLEGVPSIFKVC